MWWVGVMLGVVSGVDVWCRCWCGCGVGVVWMWCGVVW